MSVIDDRYNTLGGATGFLGEAISDEQPTGDSKARYRIYEYGAIYWTVVDLTAGFGLARKRMRYMARSGKSTKLWGAKMASSGCL